MTDAAARLDLVGRAVESIVVWARTFDSHRSFPFGDLQLSRSQVEALFLIVHADQSVTPGLLASRLDITPGAVTQLVSGLLAAGLIEQTTDPSDARRRVLLLAPQWGDRVAGFEQDLVREVAPRFDALDDDELQVLAELLARTTRTEPERP